MGMPGKGSSLLRARRLFSHGGGAKELDDEFWRLVQFHG
jgi:hypothetical protein